MKSLAFLLIFGTVFAPMLVLGYIAKKADDREAAEKRLCYYVKAHRSSFPKVVAACKQSKDK